MRLKVCLLALLFSFAPAAYADGQRTFATTVVAADVGISNIGSGIAYHKLTWTLTGTAATCQVKLQQSVDNLAWSDLIAAQTCTSNGASAITNAAVNYIRINVTVKTGTGSISVRWNGYVNPPSGGGSVTSITGTSPIVATPNPITGAGDISCPTCQTAATTPGAPLSSIQWNNAGAFGGITGTAVASDLLTWTSQAAGTVPFSMVGHATQSVPVLDISHTATATGDALFSVRGDGVGTDLALESNIIDTDASYNVVWGNAAANQRWGWYVDAGDGLNLGPLVATAPVNVSAILKASAFSSPAADVADAGIVRLANGEQICWEATPTGTDSCLENNGAEQFVFNYGIVAPAYNTTTNCSDPAGAAACGAAPAGLVVIDAGSTSVVISTTAVNDNTDVFFQATTSAQAATRLGIGGCNATVAIPSESARTSGVSITATIPAAPAVTPLCLYYWLVN